MPNYNEIRTKDIRRIIISEALGKNENHKENEKIIKTIVNLYGHSCSRDQIRTHLKWLEEQGSVKIEELSENMWVAKLTRSGKDIADGNATIPGIAEKELE